MLAHIILIEIDIYSFDGQLAAVWHCVSRIDREIHNHLLDLTRISFSTAQVRIKVDGQVNIVSQQAMQQPVYVADHQVQIQHSRRKNLLAAERQQLPGETGSSIGCLLNLLDLAVERICNFELFKHQLAITLNYRKEIVEIVCDASGKTSNRLHFLRVPQLIFKRAPLADILGDHLELSDLSLPISNRSSTQADCDWSAIFAPPAYLDVLY